MADELVPTDASQALALADARHEQALATLEDGKRRARWGGQSVPKKGKRWGLAEDKPFKPLPYVDLPVGLADKEVDQFLREQRLEDLHRKIQLHQLEDVEPDIRPPSPPPLYDRAGNRLNTREVRIRKAMVAEYNRLVRHMIKTVEGYVPPLDWRPQKLVKKIIIPYERFPQAPFMGVIIGARGVNHKRLQETTGCRIFIRGRDIGDRWQTDEEVQMLQHVHIEADTEEQIASAEKLIMPLLDPESPEFEYARTHGMQQLAVVNGFTLKKAEQRCGVCGAVGHLGFECPETGGQNYKMANVVCSICGDKGHVASDCKLAAAQREREQANWKEEAEKRQTLDAEYGRMMSELGISPPAKQQATPVMSPPAKQQASLPRQTQSGFATPSSKSAPVHAPQRPWARGAAPVQVPAPRTVAPRQAVRPPVVVAAPSRRPWASPTAPEGPMRPVAFVREGAADRPLEAAMGMPAAYRPGYAREVDDSLACPRELEPLLHSWTLEEVCQETRASVSLGPPGPGGVRRFVVEGPLEVREKAKLHLQAWMDVHLLAGHAGAAQPPPPPPWLVPPSQPPASGFPPAGFPPGFPPDTAFPPPGAGFPPAGFPPAGFPPAGFPPAGFMEQAEAAVPAWPAMSSDAFDEL